MASPVFVGDGPDAGLPWHYGEPFAEQRAMVAGDAVVDLGNRPVIEVVGPDRLTFLHSLTSQRFEGLAPGERTTALVLSPTGHIEQVIHGADDGERFLCWTEPGHGGALVEWLTGMRFMSRVEVALRDDLKLAWVDGDERIVDASETFEGRRRAGAWAYEALRIASHVPRIFLDTDFKTIPNEIGLYGTQLDKGCYRGQETVARVQNLGRPPRRLVGLHLDGSVDALPAPGSALLLDGVEVGFVGSSARHYELGPIGLGLIKRNVPTDAPLLADGIPAAQEVIVDPDIGLHFRANLR